MYHIPYALGCLYSEHFMFAVSVHLNVVCWCYTKEENKCKL